MVLGDAGSENLNPGQKRGGKVDRRSAGEDNKGEEERRRGEEEERMRGGEEGRYSWRCRFWKSRPEAAGSR